ncbi:hypothetical protein QQ045_021809 [Rhodiola kirilowii]
MSHSTRMRLMGYEIEEEEWDLGIDGGESSSVEIEGENPMAPAVGRSIGGSSAVVARGKRRSEANRPRLETRTNGPAMIKFRLMQSSRWRVIEVELEHIHLIGAASGKFCKSCKDVGPGGADKVRKTRLFRTVVVDAGGNGKVDALGEDVEKWVGDHNFTQLNLKEGDAKAVNGFLCRSQLNDPGFFYAMDLNEKGMMRNVFWADGRCRCAFNYFGDVVAVDTTCLTKKYAAPLVVIFGTNHHGQSIIFGCGLLGGESANSYIWFFKTWLTLMSEHPPRTIITNQCQILQAAVAEVFPKASHFLSLVPMMETCPIRFRGLFDSDAIRLDFNLAVYDSIKTEEFENAWE